MPFSPGEDRGPAGSAVKGEHCEDDRPASLHGHWERKSTQVAIAYGLLQPGKQALQEISKLVEPHCRQLHDRNDAAIARSGF